MWRDDRNELAILSNGSNKVQNLFQMALKWLFFKMSYLIFERAQQFIQHVGCWM